MSTLAIFVVYDRPLDYRQAFVVRQWRVMGNGSLRPELRPHAVAPSLSAARRSLPEGLTRIPRHPRDDQAIAEVWV
jgi:hypothetical protein